jgi:hypothetical protein
MTDKLESGRGKANDENEAEKNSGDENFAGTRGREGT